MLPAWLFIAVVLVLAVPCAVGGICAHKLYQWEHLLQQSRVAVSFKGKRQMTPRLIDWLVWAQRLEGDKNVNGQVIYKQGGTTIALMKPAPKDHGKTVTTTVKEES